MVYWKVYFGYFGIRLPPLPLPRLTLCKRKIAKSVSVTVNLNYTFGQLKSKLSWPNFYHLWVSFDIRVRQNKPGKESTFLGLDLKKLLLMMRSAYLLIFRNNISFSIKFYSTKHSCSYRGKQRENSSVCLLYNNWHSAY